MDDLDGVAGPVPGFGVAGKARVTVRQLLDHTGGLPFAMVPPPLGPDRIGDLEAKTAAICAMPAVYAPGTRSICTSGVGFGLLGQILVNTDPHKRGFAQIAKEELFAPLGRENTGFGAPLDAPGRVPVSFTPQNTKPSTPMMLRMLETAMDENAVVPSGNACATIDDVSRFTELFRGRGTCNGYRAISAVLFDCARQNHTGDFLHEAFGFEVEARGLDPVPARFTLLGGYVRGTGTCSTRPDSPPRPRPSPPSAAPRRASWSTPSAI
ncbi:hypothetical protein SUDANB58_00076 [Streptomyces sp. enrichment culture]|uniref:serine hydrolase domain-containing protein n=1 Tax=Streptomyces sp. enrichment culture TaxID=1795815 RepID=UPI003F5712F2